MPAPAKPRPQVAAPKRRVQLTGVPQETFAEPAKALAEKLGWSGNPEWETNGITVRDAQRFVQKTMHEHHQAGALGNDQPDHHAACVHLAVDSADEQAAIDAALGLAFESGKGQAVTSADVKSVSLDAKFTGSGSAMLGKMAGSK